MKTQMCDKKEVFCHENSESEIRCVGSCLQKNMSTNLGRRKYDDFILLAHRDWSSQDFLPWLLLRAPLICKRFLPQAFFNLIGIHKPDPSMIALKTNLTCEASRWVVTSTAHFPWWGSREIDPLDLEN